MCILSMYKSIKGSTEFIGSFLLYQKLFLSVNSREIQAWMPNYIYISIRFPVVEHEYWPYTSHFLLRAVEGNYMQNEQAELNFPET